MTKEQLVSRYKQQYPNLSKYSDDKLYASLIQKFPEYRTQMDDPIKYDADNLFDSLPNFIKKGYNESIQGIASQLMTGNQRFDLSGYEPGILEDIGSGIASMFASPADLAVGVFGGGVGGAVAKRVAVKTIAKKLVRNGVKSNRALDVAKRASSKAYGIGIGKSTGALAGYEGVKSGFKQRLETGDVKLDEVVKDTLSGAVLGGVSAGTGAYLTSKGFSTMTKVLGETGALGTTMPITEGEIPTPQDYINAGGMILGLKAVGGAVGSIPKLKNLVMEGRKPSLKKEKIADDLAEEFGTTIGKMDDVQRRQSEVYLDKDGGKWSIISEPGAKKIKLTDYKTGQRTLTENQFANTYKLADEIDIPLKNLKKDRVIKLRSLESNSNISDAMKQTLRYSSLDLNTKKAFKAVQGDLDLKLDYLKPSELYRYRDALLRRKSVVNAIDKLKADGWVTQEAKYSIFKENFFPKPVANLLQGLVRTKYRGSQKQPIRKYFADVGRYTTDKDALTGEYLGRLINTGLFNPSKKDIVKFKKSGMSMKDAENAYYRNLSKEVELGLRPEINAVTALIARRFTSTGGQIPGYIQNYVPQMMNRDVADVIFDDMLNALTKKKELSKIMRDKYDVTSTDKILVDMTANPDRFISKNPELSSYLDSLIKRAEPGFKNETKELLRANLESGSNLEYLRAFSRVGNGLQNELFNMFGNLEKKRKFIIPEELLERNLKTLLTRYSTKAASRTSFVRNFGAKSEKFQTLLDRSDQKDKGIMRELHHHVKGDIEYHSNYNYKKNTKDMWQQVMEYETGLKIGLGYAPVLNVTQSTISTALEAGYIPFFRGIFSLTDKKTKELIERSGVTNYSMFNEMIGVTQSTNTSGKIVDILSRYSGFNGINKINQVLAASTARVLVDDMFKAVKGRGIRGKFRLSRQFASNKLRQLDIDPKKSRLTDDDYIKAMSKFARKTQLQKDILEDPLVFNNPKIKPFVQFKRFGYRQFNYIKDLFYHDISMGNVMPILRLGVAGVAGGTIANKSKEIIRAVLSGDGIDDFNDFVELVSGNRSIDTDAQLPKDFQDVVENLSAVGAFGFTGDLISATMEEGRSYANSLKFLAFPPFLSDIDNLLTRFMPAVERDFKMYRADALKRMPTRLARLSGSSFIREAGKRFETEGMTIDRIKNMRSRRLDKILTMLEKANTPEDYDKAYEELNTWNTSFSEYPILAPDISLKKIYKRKARRYKKQALG